MRPRLAPQLLALFLLFASGTEAAALDAKELRADILSALEEVIEPRSGLDLTYEEVRVWPEGEAYRVEIAALKGIPQGGEMAVDFGALRFLAKPLPNGFYEVSGIGGFEEVRLLDAEGQMVALLTLEIERFAGTWAPSLVNFLDLDLLLKDLRMASVDGQFTARLEQVGMVGRAEPGNGDKVNQDASLKAVGLRAEAPGQGAVTVDEIRMEALAKDLDLAAVTAFNSEVDALSQRETPPEAEELAVILGRLSEIPVLPEEWAQRYVLSGLTLTDADGQELARLREVEWDTAMRGFAKSLTEVRLGLQHQGLGLGEAARAGAGPWGGLVPNDLGLVVSVENLPARELWKRGIQIFALTILEESSEAPQKSSYTPAQAPTNPLSDQLMFELMQIMFASGTRFSLSHLDYQSEISDIAAQGAFAVDPAAAQGHTGELTLSLTGLDQIIALMQADAQAGNQQSQMALGFAFWLKGLARRETDPDGRAVDNYLLQVLADGQVLLNGVPFGFPGMAPQ